MAAYKVQAPDGSIIQLEGPDNATEAQIGQAAQAAYAQRQSQPAQQPSVMNEIGRQIGLTGRGAIEGVTNLAGIVIDPATRLANMALPAGAQIPTMQQATAQVLDAAGFPQPRDATERLVNQAVQGASGAGGMAAMAGRAAQAAASPVVREGLKTLAAQPASQITAGAGAGMAGQAVREAGGTPLGEVAASVLGGVAGGSAGARLAGAPRATTVPKVQTAINEAERVGVPVMTSDAIPPETFMGRTAQRIGERIPIAGTGPLRAEQQQARISSVRDLLRDFGADDAANLGDDIIKDLASKRSAERIKYSNAKGEVINRLDSQGVVPTPNTSRKIDEIVARLTKENTDASLEAAARLETIKAGGSSGVGGRTLSQMEAFRRDELANAFKDDPTRPISIAARDVGEKALREIYDPVRKDMGEFIRSTGERQDFNKWMVANQRLGDMASDLKMTSFKSLLKSGEATPEVVVRMLTGPKPSEVRQIYSSLSPVGRANGRSAILAHAAEKSKYDLADGTRAYSPEKFNAEIKRLDPQIGIFFQGDDAARVNGLSRVLTLTRRAGEAGVATATGQEAVPFVAGSALQGLFGSFGGALAAAGGIGAVARVYESAPVRNLLLQLGKSKPGSSQEVELEKRLLSVLQSQGETLK